MPELNFFQSMNYLEPKCPKCGIALEYDINTKFSSKYKSHVCLKCGEVLK